MPHVTAAVKQKLKTMKQEIISLSLQLDSDNTQNKFSINQNILTLCINYFNLCKDDSRYKKHALVCLDWIFYLDGMQAFTLLGLNKEYFNDDLIGPESLGIELKHGGKEEYFAALEELYLGALSVDSMRNGFILLQIAGAQGSADAMSILGRAYLMGFGVRQDLMKAHNCFVAALKIDDANPNAWFYLAVMYENYFGEPTLEQKNCADKYYKFAIEVGHIQAYESIQNKRLDLEIKTLKKSYKACDHYALAMIYHAKNDTENACYWFKLAASKGDKLAMQEFSSLYPSEYLEWRLVQMDSSQALTTSLGTFAPNPRAINGADSNQEFQFKPRK